MAFDYVNFSGLSHFYDKIKTKFASKDDLANKMDKSNPTGTGTLSINRKGNIGTYSVTVGMDNTASGNYGSFAEGSQNTTSGWSAHVEGRSNTASGNYSHAEGYSNIVSQESAHVEGNNNSASGKSAHVEGCYNTASGDYQHVQGKYNINDTSNTYAHIVGNGDSSTRSNAHTLDWDGNAEFSGDVIAYGCGGTTPISLNELNSRPVNNNILINSNFANPVNQREVVSPVVNSDANAAFYTIDRWEMYGTGKLIINDGESITLENTGNLSLYQYIENSELLEGKKVALSAKVNGKIYSNVDTVNQSGGKAVIRVYDDSGVQQCVIYLQYMSNKNLYRVVVGVDNTSVTVEWIKLEVGEVATPYVPRLYEEEYTLCQYYYQVFYSNSNTAFLSNSSEAIFTVQCPSKMRVKNSTNALRDGWKVFPNNCNGADQYVSGLTVQQCSSNTFQNKVYIKFAGTSLPFGDTNKPFLDAVITMDAEI